MHRESGIYKFKTFSLYDSYLVDKVRKKSLAVITCFHSVHDLDGTGNHNVNLIFQRDGSCYFEMYSYFVKTNLISPLSHNADGDVDPRRAALSCSNSERLHRGKILLKSTCSGLVC
jgi:hypothetical protein